MDKNIVQSILKLNNDFYSIVAEEFDKTRQVPWLGWKRIVKIINNTNFEKKNISILDLACGNGRLYPFLDNNLKQKFNYLGIDNNNSLLKIAKGQYQKTSFQKEDIFINLQKVINKFDLVFAFGITHHIPSQEFRKSWFSELPGLLNKNGLLVFSIWNFTKDRRFIKNAVKSAKNIQEKDLEKGDFFIPFGKTRAIRYFHEYPEDEILEIIEILEQKGLKLYKRFFSDGKSRRLNDYFVFQKL